MLLWKMVSALHGNLSKVFSVTCGLVTAEQKFDSVVLLPCLLLRAAGLNPEMLADLTSSIHVAMHAVMPEAVMCFLQMRRLPLPLNPRHMKTQQKR